MEKPSASTSNTRNAPQRKNNQGGSRQSGTARQQVPERLRGFDTDPYDIRISKTISWLLRHSAQTQGLAIRTDGYAKVSDIVCILSTLGVKKLRNPQLQHKKITSRGVTLEKIQEIVKADEKQRFDLRLEPSEGSTEGVWWMKANQGHSAKVRCLTSELYSSNQTGTQGIQLDLQPITKMTDIPTGIAVHGTNRKAWESIGGFSVHHGLSKTKKI